MKKSEPVSRDKESFDYAHIPAYFALGWQGGGELPSAVQFMAVVLAAIGAIAADVRSPDGVRMTTDTGRCDSVGSTSAHPDPAEPLR